MLILRALAYQQQGETSAAHTAINKALLMAEPEGFIRLFADEGEALGRLLQSLPTQSDYVKQIIKAIHDFSDEPDTSPLLEPLTEREQEILILIAAGLSNKQIAEELILSLSTVKWYTSQIYGKLGVGRRTEAVERGRSLGILV